MLQNGTSWASQTRRAIPATNEKPGNMTLTWMPIFESPGIKMTFITWDLGESLPTQIGPHWWSILTATQTPLEGHTRAHTSVCVPREV